MPSEKIIIVDDEADVLDLCSRVLKFDGYHVRTAKNGYEAIEIAQEDDFDLLLTDIKMPGMDGLEITQALKNSYPHLICVTMTGYSTIDMVIEALKLGIDEFITKPFTPKELSRVVAKALETERLRKENFRLHSLIPLFELNNTLMGTVEVDKLLHRLLEIAQKETNADTAIIYLFDKGNVSTFNHLHLNEQPDYEPAIAFEKLANFVFQESRQLTLNQDEMGHQSYSSPLEDIKLQAIIATPLKTQSSNHGVLILARKDTDFAPSDSDFLAVLSGQAGIALENARLFTETQEAYRQLQMLDHMKSEFINIAAHELRTPLAILMGYASVLEQDLTGIQSDYLSKISRHAMRLRTLIDDMLNLQHLESGTMALAQDKVVLRQALSEIVQDMSLMIDQKGLDITIDIPPDFPLLIADRQKLDLIIMNLLHNAIKFTPADGQVVFTAKADGQKAVMSVSDTGIGIPQEAIKRIFDRFYQVEKSLTREYGGIGLGLAITRGMVEVCGGEICVESEEGKGTTFVITLPLDNTTLGQRLLKLN
jgi:signal transduction histidine kinase/DNA-binding response OmpR family regulator